jgi:hypothetical protein
MAKTFDVFSAIKRRDPGFEVKMDLDEQKRVRSILFAHGSSIVDYSAFGDVVTFDTTYRTNLYNLPFGLFVGVNHHFQSIIFAGVLLTEETIDAFDWTFWNFIAAMGGRAPQTILTGFLHSYSSYSPALQNLYSIHSLFLHFSLCLLINCSAQTNVIRCVLQSVESYPRRAIGGANGMF